MRSYLPTIAISLTLLGYLLNCLTREVIWFDVLFAVVLGVVWMLVVSQLVGNRDQIAQARAREKAASTAS